MRTHGEPGAAHAGLQPGLCLQHVGLGLQPAVELAGPSGGPSAAENACWTSGSVVSQPPVEHSSARTAGFSARPELCRRAREAAAQGGFVGALPLSGQN